LNFIAYLVCCRYFSDKLEIELIAESQTEADVEFHCILAPAIANPIYVLLMDALAELLHESDCRTIGLVGIQSTLRGRRAI
jgi:DNA-binding FadR family transcriptional regulator